MLERREEGARAVMIEVEVGNAIDPHHLP